MQYEFSKLGRVSKDVKLLVNNDLSLIEKMSEKDKIKVLKELLTIKYNNEPIVINEMRVRDLGL